MKKTLVIDCFAKNSKPYPDNYAVIAIDVIRATTTATSAIALGRDVYPAANADDATVLAATLKSPILSGEMGGHVPFGFHLTNSPVQVTALSIIEAGAFTDASRPLVLVSSSGTPLVMKSRNSSAVYLSCLRNYQAVADYVADRHDQIAIIGAGTRGVFRIEDQIGCAWLAEALLQKGFDCENHETQEIVSRWSGCDPEIIRESESADYLRRSGQVHDLEFIISRIDDLSVVPIFRNRHFENSLYLNGSGVARNEK